MKSIYLCGPINGKSDSECKDWRERAKSLLLRCATIDPMRRDYRGRELENGIAEEIVSGDEADIYNSTHVLVLAEQPSWGTAMEIRIAYELGKPVYVVYDSDKPISPWLSCHSFRVFKTLEDACCAIMESAA